jgi:hypothetical protein
VRRVKRTEKRMSPEQSHYLRSNKKENTNIQQVALPNRKKKKRNVTKTKAVGLPNRKE